MGPQDITAKQCVFCGGPVRLEQSTKYSQTLEEEGRVLRVSIEGVPAEVCQQCGEKEYPAEVAEQILAIVEKAKTETRTLFFASRFYSFTGQELAG